MRPVSTLPRRSLPLLVLALCSGCASGPGPTPPAAPLWCPPPLTWTEGEPRPVRLEITNETDRDLRAFLDECMGQVRLGSVPSGQSVSFRLPNRLIAFSGQLYVQMGDPEAQVHFGNYAVPVRNEWSLTLTINNDTPLARKNYDSAAPPPEPYQGMDGFLTAPGREISYASRWADGSDAVLTWVCHKEDPQLSFSPVYTDADELPVTMRFAGSSGEIRSSWTVVHGRSDNLQAPGTAIATLTSEALGADTVWVSVGEEKPGPQHRFKLDGLPEALELLPCFKGIRDE